MIFRPCSVDGAWVIEPSPHVDSRGRFMRAWCLREFASHGINFVPVQANLALSAVPGTIRGLHYQVAPALEAKLVRCTRGSAFDVVVDVRPASPTYGAWYGMVLDAENGRMLYVPEGCAHGCQSMQPDTEVLYMTSAFYSPKDARGVRYDDPAIAVRWPLPVTSLSEQDRNWPLLGKH